jgi:hypothetical protein
VTAPRPFATLRRFLPAKGAERCDLCGIALAQQHPHLLEVGTRRLVCSCDPCAILFEHRGAAQHRRVPRRVRYDPQFRMSDAEWDSLLIPIGLAFFVRCTPERRVLAFYPGPAGTTESLLSMETWARIEAENPALREMEADVEALLVNRVGSARDHYIVPIDHCYHLTGLIRMRWQGLSGGEEVWREIGQFFARLQEAGGA